MVETQSQMDRDNGRRGDKPVATATHPPPQERRPEPPPGTAGCARGCGCMLLMIAVMAYAIWHLFFS